MNKTDRLIDELTREIVANYRVIETELIYKVALIWKNLQSHNGNLEHFLSMLEKLDILNTDTLNIISEITGKPLSVLEQDLKEIGYTSIDKGLFTKAYEKGLIAHIPSQDIIDNVINQQTVLLQKNINDIQRNVTSGLYKQTFKAISKAQLEVELGVKSPNQAIFEAVEELASKGVHTSTYLREGKEVHRSMEATVRMAVRTSFIQTVNNLQEDIAKDIGTEYWYVTQHLGARTSGTGHQNHAQWQGAVYTDKEMVTKLGEGKVDGFAGINCRHRKIIYIPGVSVPPPPRLDMEELERVYKLEQEQRRMESDIRKTKRIIHTLELLDSEEANERVIDMKKRLRKQQAKVRKHVKSNEDVLRRDYTREKVISP